MSIKSGVLKMVQPVFSLILLLYDSLLLLVQSLGMFGHLSLGSNTLDLSVGGNVS